MNNNRLTASQIAKELTLRTGKNVTVNKVQKALESLGYVEKQGKKYIPTNRGSYYSQKEVMYQNGYNVPFYKWDKSIINEIAYELEE